jgi:DNA mismatch repair protein MutS
MAKKKTPQETPMMKQYYSFKEKYPGAILLFRVGDFYETFGEDAIKASKILGITLTKRHNGAASEMELAGFPHHSLEAYLPKLVRAGQRVAICDQVEDPRFAKKLVKRDVTELVTPGVSYHDNVLDTKHNNYLAALHQQKEQWGIALLDISTGEFLLAQGSEEYVDKLLQSFQPAELLFNKKHKQAYYDRFGDQYHVFFLDDWFFQFDFATDALLQHFKTQSLKGFGIADQPEGIVAAGAVMHYLSESRHTNLQHISSLARLEESNYVWLDKFTIRSLELLYPQHENGVALIDVLDQTVTPMGARLLRKWVALPLKEVKRIEERQQIVKILLEDPEVLEKTVDSLKPMGDLERLISKVASLRIKPRELQQIKRALGHIATLKQWLESSPHELLHKFGNQLNNCQFLYDKIDKTLLDEPKNVLNEGQLIKAGVDAELDELQDIVRNSKDYLEQVRLHAIEETGISSLKVDYNKVYGYYLEVTHTHRSKVPKSWIRKQTLTNAERYITEELKVYEDKILNAEEKIFVIEQRCYEALVREAVDFTQSIQQNARVLATLDCLSNFAHLAQKNRYTCPTLSDDNALQIVGGRHPVIEQQLPPATPYIPNDTYLDSESQQILVITGPNMAGKSALLRQVALITLMAQMGCFVPAEKAHIGIVDKVFTRVGASDNLSKGESTFMVEMTETASIMNNLSDRSLLLMDEIGRGTSTYDGISIAWAILEYLHQHPNLRPRTLFATHYHELNELSKSLERIKNYHVMVKEAGNKIVFMRKLAEGGSEHSFGIHVAQMAGMPQQIVRRAEEIMQHLEQNRSRKVTQANLQELPQQVQMHIFEPSPEVEALRKYLKKIDVNSLAPIEALLKLNELKNMLK